MRLFETLPFAEQHFVVKSVMALGFPAQYIEQIEIEVDRDVARQAIVETLESLGWIYESPNRDSFLAKTDVNILSWGEKVSVEFTENAALRIRSVCSMLQIFDWGKNKKNVDSFVALFTAKAARIAKLWPLDGVPAFDESGNTPLQRALADEDL
jgi:hypothetical protein